MTITDECGQRVPAVLSAGARTIARLLCDPPFTDARGPTRGSLIKPSSTPSGTRCRRLRCRMRITCTLTCCGGSIA